jgi:TolB protein
MTLGQSPMRYGERERHYIARDGSKPAALYQVTALGRNPRKLIERVDYPGLALSPDGKRLAFVRWDGREETLLMVANADGSDERKLAARKVPDMFSGGLAWSPDGKLIACSVFRINTDSTVVTMNVEGGAKTRLTSQKWFVVGSVAWLADGSGLIISAKERPSPSGQQLWHLSYPDGEVRKLTNDLNGYAGVSLTADSKALVTSQWGSSSSNLWLASNGEASRAIPIPSRTSKDDGLGGLCWTPDGKIVYTSTASGNMDLWIMEADGSNQKQLTMNAGENFLPAVSADGRSLVFVSTRAGGLSIWRMDLDGGNTKQLASGGNITH